MNPGSYSFLASGLRCRRFGMRLFLADILSWCSALVSITFILSRIAKQRLLLLSPQDPSFPGSLSGNGENTRWGHRLIQGPTK